MNRLHRTFFCILTIVALAGCQKDNLRPAEPVATRPISARVSSVETKAAGACDTLVAKRTIDEHDGIMITESVFENNSLPFGAATKGTQVTTDNITGFNMTAYAEGTWWKYDVPTGSLGSETNPHPAGKYFGPASVSGTNTVGDGLAGTGWVIDGAPTWINKTDITFWSWTGTEPSYSPAGTAATVSDYVNAGQTDLIYAYNRENREFNADESIKGGKDATIDIHFYHALAAVQFFAGSLPSGYYISNIELSEVANTTTFTMNCGSALTFSHTPSNLTSFSQTYTNGDASLAPRSTYPYNDVTDSKTLFMVPQTFATDSEAKITVTFTNGSDTYTHTADLAGTSWKAGYYYVYKISAAGEVSVTVGEQFNATTKSNVCFANDNNVSEYIRAAVIANWYDESGNIVAPCTVSFTASGWTKGSDGFYYCDEPVGAGTSSPYLIDSYTKTTAPISGAHLEMTILAQAVASKGISSCTAAFQ